MAIAQFVMFIRGLPGAGKSTISSKISVINNSVLIDPDLIPNKNSRLAREERLRKYRICLNNAKRATKEGFSVVWAQPWRKIENIQITIRSLNSDHIKFLLVNINIPVEESWNRSKNRFLNNRKYFDDYTSKFITFRNNFEIDSVSINGMGDVKKNIAKITKFLRYNTEDE